MHKSSLFTLGFFSIAAFFAFNLYTGYKVKNNPAKEFHPKIELQKSMVLNESAMGEAWKLVDEQQKIGNPALGSGTKPSTTWNIDWNKEQFYPLSAVIDLGQEYELSNIYLFDGAGVGMLTVSAGNPFEWNALFAEELTKYNEWRNFPVTIRSRYLQVKFHKRVEMPEIVIYGRPVGERANPNVTPTSGKEKTRVTTMGELIGINAFIDDPLDKIKVAGFVREYHVWDWDEGNGRTNYPGYPRNENAFNPSYPSDGWRFDEYYQRLHDVGITVATCIQMCPKWLCEGDNEKPIQAGLDPTVPASYKEHADHLFQVAARYGSKKVPDNLLKLAANQSRKSGLNLVRYYENWNEQDKDWVTRKEYFTPYEFAAMSSADYDGHMGTMGKTFGIKNADPDAKLVMGGISTLNLEYIKSIVFWAQFNRKGEVPFDVINLHHYSNDAGRQRSLGKIGISPEADSLKEKLELFVAYRNKFLPDKEVWITEFGYDTHPESIQRAPAIGDFSQEEVQAIWLVRSFLALAAAKVDRAAMYMLRDTEAINSARQFSTSGLTGGKKSKHAPKPSWFYVNTLRSRLEDLYFHRDYSSAGVMNYEFINNETNEGAVVVWLPTSNAEVKENHSVKLPSFVKKATLIEFENKNPSGSSKELQISNNKVVVDLSEKPVIIKW